MELKGLDEVKRALADLTGEYRPAQLRNILDPAGNLVKNAAKARVQFPGILAEDFKKDIAVTRDRRKVAASAEYIIIGPRFKNYTINRKEQKVAVIAQHITEGFNQTERTTKSGQKRGKVSYRVENPMTQGLADARSGVNTAINVGIVKGLNKVKAKYRSIV
jgi:hypothetical protein